MKDDRGRVAFKDPPQRGSVAHVGHHGFDGEVGRDIANAFFGYKQAILPTSKHDDPCGRIFGDLTHDFSANGSARPSDEHGRPREVCRNRSRIELNGWTAEQVLNPHGPKALQAHTSVDQVSKAGQRLCLNLQ